MREPRWKPMVFPTGRARRDYIYKLAMHPIEKSILLYVDHFASGDTGRCYLKVDQMVEDTAHSRKAIFEHMANLEDRGWLKIERQRGSYSYYTLQMPVVNQ